MLYYPRDSHRSRRLIWFPPFLFCFWETPHPILPVRTHLGGAASPVLLKKKTARLRYRIGLRAT